MAYRQTKETKVITKGSIIKELAEVGVDAVYQDSHGGIIFASYDGVDDGIESTVLFDPGCVNRSISNYWKAIAKGETK